MSKKRILISIPFSPHIFKQFFAYLFQVLNSHPTPIDNLD
jgi:hypothetical protein